MAKAHITTRDGTKITIEGSADEVANLAERLGGSSAETKTNRMTAPTSKPSGKASLGNLVIDLIDGGFFKKPKELSAVKLALEEQGHFYPATTLSPLLLRLVRKKQLRRLKQEGRWVYVG